MMDQIELIEKLREKADITVEEAKEVLEKNQWDLLDAMIELERQGKVKGSEKAATTTTETKQEEKYEIVTATVTGDDYEKKEEEASKGKGFGKQVKETLKFIWSKMVDNRFIIKRKDEIVVKVPVIVLAILLLLGLWRTVLVLGIGLLFKFRYSFEGEDLGTEQVNKTMDKAGEFADNLMNNTTNE